MKEVVHGSGCAGVGNCMVVQPKRLLSRILVSLVGTSTPPAAFFTFKVPSFWKHGMCRKISATLYSIQLWRKKLKTAFAELKKQKLPTTSLRAYEFCMLRTKTGNGFWPGSF